MPAYHSAFNDQTFQQLGNTSLLPLKKQQKSAGPAPIFDGPDDDVIDEAINLFRANCFFRNFEVKGPGDRVLIYLTIFISECLGKLAVKSVNVKEASVLLYNHAVGSFSVPGEASFPLNSIFAVPQNRNDQDTLRQYLQQLRIEMAARLVTRVFYDGTDKPSKWWMCFSKRKFMGITGTL